MAARDTSRPVMMAQITPERVIGTDLTHLGGVEWVDFKLFAEP